MSWENEVEPAIVGAIVNTGAITKHLVNPSALYKDQPVHDAGYPVLTYSWAEGDAIDHNRVEVILDIDIWAEYKALDAIRYALQDELDERLRLANENSASPITMASWICKHFRYLHSDTRPTQVFVDKDNKRELIQRTTKWQVRLCLPQTRKAMEDLR